MKIDERLSAEIEEMESGASMEKEDSSVEPNSDIEVAELSFEDENVEIVSDDESADLESISGDVSENEESSSDEKAVEVEVIDRDDNDKAKHMIDYSQISSTDDIEVPPLLIDQVIGHEESVETIKKAAKQRRNVLLIGDPGVGKSMLAKGMAELLPPEVLQDVLVYPNPEDQNHPLIRTVPAGEGKKIVKMTKAESKGDNEKKTMIATFAIAAIFVLGILYNRIFEAIIAGLLIIFIAMQIKPRSNAQYPKLLVNNGDKRFAPFFDATGAHAGALLGDVRHDPYQSGGTNVWKAE